LLAKLEGEIVLTALSRRVKTLQIVGNVERRYNNTLRGLASLPLEVKCD
jgi:cytochrome P450